MPRCYCFFQAALVAIKKINRSFAVTKPLLMQFKKVNILPVNASSHQSSVKLPLLFYYKKLFCIVCFLLNTA